MFKTIFLFLCVAYTESTASKANHNITCDSSSKHGIYFEPSRDNVRGRYIVKWCITVNVTASCWKVTITYWPNNNTASCNQKNLRSGMVHSRFTENVQSNCTNICLTRAVDVVFNATCYHIQTSLGTQELTSKGSTYITFHRNNSYHYVADSYSKEQFNESRTYVNHQNDGDDVIIDWYLGYVPATDYRVKFSLKEKELDVYHSCSTLGAQQSHVRCRARLDTGCYNITFQHYKPWGSGFGHNKGPFMYYFCHAKSASYVRAPPEQLRAKRTEQWWALGGALALVLGAVLLLGARRARLAIELRKSTRQQWLDGDKHTLSPPAGTAPRAGRVLLLYARDSVHVSRAAQLLAGLLRHSTGYEVVDLYNPETVSAAAPAGAEWLRALLTGADTRVLLLQTPATSLYCSQLVPSDSGSPKLQAPLLLQQVVWRCPHAADPLLQLALRLLTETAHNEPLPYKKYYVASIAGVQHNEAVPAVTPQRRYLLPYAAGHLLDHIAAPSVSASSSTSPALPPTIPDCPSELPTVSSDSPPSAPESPTLVSKLSPSVSEVPPLEPERSRLLQQLWSTLEEFRRYTITNPNYLFTNLVCE